jgi:acetyltransferase
VWTEGDQSRRGDLGELQGSGGGLERERQLKEIADRSGIAFIGPHCRGLIDTDPACRLNASFAWNMPAEGNIRSLSQSGA